MRARRRRRVAVVGGGIAGLCAGAYLASRGLEAVVCEAAGEAGGYVGTFRRGGYAWDKGARAVEDAGALRPMLRGLGLAGRLRLLTNPVGLGVEGRLFPMAGEADATAWFAALGELYPARRAELALVAADALAASRAADGLYGGGNPLFGSLADMAFKVLPWTLRNRALFRDLAGGRGVLAVGLVDYLRARIPDEGLVRLLSQSFFAGTTVFFGLGYARLFRDYSYPAGGMGALSGALADAIGERGGTVRVGALVESVAVDGRGRAVGLVLAGGEFLGADAVIAAGDGLELQRALLPEGLRAPRGSPGESVVTAYIEAAIAPDELGRAGCAHGIHAPDREGLFLLGRAGGAFSSSSVEFSIPCLRDPCLAPAGRCGVIASSASPYGFWAGKRASGEAAYEAAKAEAGRALVESLATLWPGLPSRVEGMTVATPLTMERATRNSGGSIAGFALTGGGCGAERDFRRFKRAVEGPARGLWRAGHWTFAPAGIPVALMTGKLAADLATLELDPGAMR